MKRLALNNAAQAMRDAGLRRRMRMIALAILAYGGVTIVCIAFGNLAWSEGFYDFLAAFTALGSYCAWHCGDAIGQAISLVQRSKEH